MNARRSSVRVCSKGLLLASFVRLPFPFVSSGRLDRDNTVGAEIENRRRMARKKKKREREREREERNKRREKGEEQKLHITAEIVSTAAE